jgi:hypothetical protein
LPAGGGPITAAGLRCGQGGRPPVRPSQPSRGGGRRALPLPLPLPCLRCSRASAAASPPSPPVHHRARRPAGQSQSDPLPCPASRSLAHSAPRRSLLQFKADGRCCVLTHPRTPATHGADRSLARMGYGLQPLPPRCDAHLIPSPRAAAETCRVYPRAGVGWCDCGPT